MVRQVARTVSPPEKIVLFLHPVRDYEASISMVMQLGFHGAKSPVYVHPAGDYLRHPAVAVSMLTGQFPRRVDTAGLPASFLRRLRSPRNPDPGRALTGEEVGAVVVLTPASTWKAQPPPWFRPAAYRRIVFRQPNWAARGFGWKPGGGDHYLVFERIRPASSSHLAVAQDGGQQSESH